MGEIERIAKPWCRNGKFVKLPQPKDCKDDCELLCCKHSRAWGITRLVREQCPAKLAALKEAIPELTDMEYFFEHNTHYSPALKEEINKLLEPSDGGFQVFGEWNSDQPSKYEQFRQPLIKEIQLSILERRVLECLADKEKRSLRRQDAPPKYPAQSRIQFKKECGLTGDELEEQQARIEKFLADRANGLHTPKRNLETIMMF